VKKQTIQYMYSLYKPNPEKFNISFTVLAGERGCFDFLSSINFPVMNEFTEEEELFHIIYSHR